MSNTATVRDNALSQNFGVLSLLKFTAPTIIMMLFMSLYTMVDGVFVSNFIGENALSAVNIVYPFVSVIIAVAIMFATGGSAIIARKMGEGKQREAKEDFSLIIAVGVLIGIVIVIAGLVWIEPIIRMLGSTPALHDYCVTYLRILIVSAPVSILQMLFQFFFVTAGKPKLGLAVTVAGGAANVVLDYVFMVPLNMGIAGAALGTSIGYSIPAVFGLIYFWVHRHGTLYFVKPQWRPRMLLQSCLNGSSEMVTNLATAVTTYLFNIVMLRYLGENGVAAITIVLYAQFLLTSVYLGFSSGVAPVFSYNYGEGNKTALKKLFKISMGFLFISSVVIFAAAILLSNSIVHIFVRADSDVFAIARKGFLLFSIGYLFTGINIFSSSLFTAFSNGKVSAIISFLRTFVFILVAIVALPPLIGEAGIWLSVPFAELVTLLVSAGFLARYRRRYAYL